MAVSRIPSIWSMARVLAARFAPALQKLASREMAPARVASCLATRTGCARAAPPPRCPLQVGRVAQHVGPLQGVHRRAELIRDTGLAEGDADSEPALSERCVRALCPLGTRVD
jgi:hypothetical protein